MRLNIPLPPIPEEQKSPLIRQLLDIIDSQNHLLQQQAEQIQQLKDEIARLKNQPPRPKIQPSRLEKKRKKKHKASKGKRPGSEKRHKTAELKINEDKPIEPEHIPPGSFFRYYKDWVVQDHPFQGSTFTFFFLQVFSRLRHVACSSWQCALVVLFSGL